MLIVKRLFEKAIVVFSSANAIPINAFIWMISIILRFKELKYIKVITINNGSPNAFQ